MKYFIAGCRGFVGRNIKKEFLLKKTGRWISFLQADKVKAKEFWDSIINAVGVYEEKKRKLLERATSVSEQRQRTRLRVNIHSYMRIIQVIFFSEEGHAAFKHSVCGYEGRLELDERSLVGTPNQRMFDVYKDIDKDFDEVKVTLNEGESDEDELSIDVNLDESLAQTLSLDKFIRSLGKIKTVFSKVLSCYDMKTGGGIEDDEQMDPVKYAQDFNFRSWQERLPTPVIMFLMKMWKENQDNMREKLDLLNRFVPSSVQRDPFTCSTNIGNSVSSNSSVSNASNISASSKKSRLSGTHAIASSLLDIVKLGSKLVENISVMSEGSKEKPIDIKLREIDAVLASLQTLEASEKIQQKIEQLQQKKINLLFEYE
mmetsp:Transcript_18116/g.20468  ORF Transcript_18116/g.20468 Transcript_18116/m.20468 type:complete len:372 (+) Transcript_18116:129-1244(+)